MNCSECVKANPVEAVPYIVHESDMARVERSVKRSWILCIILAVLLIASWTGFLIYESQFETVTETTQTVWQDADSGSNRFIGGDYFGDTESYDN